MGKMQKGVEKVCVCQKGVEGVCVCMIEGCICMGEGIDLWGGVNSALGTRFIASSTYL